MTQSLTLKACRVNVGLSQETAATKLGISKETLSNYERGLSFPDVPIIKRIESLYGVGYNDINFFVKTTVKP